MSSLNLFDALPESPAVSPERRSAAAKSATSLPSGLHYEQDFLSHAEETQLIEQLASIEFAPFMLRGYPSKRQVASYGMALDFRGGTSWPQRPPPDYLQPCIHRVASRLGIQPAELAHVLVTVYPPGAIINWHRDAAQFEVICGVSLGSAATLRLRPCSQPLGEGGYGRRGQTRGAADPAARQERPSPRGQAISIGLAPRSLYFMRGESRTDWEHSIAPLAATRYSITLRTLYG